MSQKSKKLPLFYKIYFGALIIFVLLLTALLIFLNRFISDYNKGLAETVSENFFNETFVELDTQKIIDMASVTHSEFESDTDTHSFLKNTLSSDLTYTSVSSSSGEKKYIVKSGQYKCASFTLIPDENGDYHPNTLSLHLPKQNPYVIKVLDSSTLFINGIEVGDSYITSTEDHISAKYLPENVPSPKWVTYTIEGLTREPDIKIIDRNGKQTTSSVADGVICEEIIYDEPEKEIIDRIVKGAEQYAICMQDDAPKSSVYPYFEKGTDLYDSIRTVLNIFVWDHAGYAIEDEKAYEYFRYDENTVSLRVSFTHVLKMYGREDYRDITDITYYARNIDGTYYIFARHNNI